ncbi:MAG: hypothetical protein IJP68_01730 [Selenomonadaceae bacterium]|nr:hypothetical protein [Selenomonadaceae bacterium]
MRLWKNATSARRITKNFFRCWVAFSPLANGLLSGAYKKAQTFMATGDYRNMMPQFTTGRKFYRRGIYLSPEEIADLDAKLDTMDFEVFGGSEMR